MILFCHVGKWLVYNGNRKPVTMEVKIMASKEMEMKKISDNDLEFVSGGLDLEEYKKMMEHRNNAPKPLAPKNSPGGNDCFGALKNKEGENEDTGLA